MRRFMGEVLELSGQSDFKIHFASAREAFNIVIAAVEGLAGEPGDYRDYKLWQIMQESRTQSNAASKRPVEPYAAEPMMVV